MITRSRTSTLFPYTTLFRSTRTPRTASGSKTGPTSSGASIASYADTRIRAPAATTACSHGRRQHRSQARSEEHTSELQSHVNLVCRLLLEKKKDHLNTLLFG